MAEACPGPASSSQVTVSGARMALASSTSPVGSSRTPTNRASSSRASSGRASSSLASSSRAATSRSQFEPGQLEPGQFEPGQFEPGQFEPGQFEPSQFGPGPHELGRVPARAAASRPPLIRHRRSRQRSIKRDSRQPNLGRGQVGPARIGPRPHGPVRLRPRPLNEAGQRRPRTPTTQEALRTRPAGIPRFRPPANLNRVRPALRRLAPGVRGSEPGGSGQRRPGLPGPASRPQKRTFKSRSTMIRIGSLVCAAVVVIIAGVTGVGQSDPSVTHERQGLPAGLGEPRLRGCGRAHHGPAADCGQCLAQRF